MGETLINQKGTGCIYCVTNKVNGKQYIGKTEEYYINTRWCKHKASARNGDKNYFHNAIRKYGEENFAFEVILKDIPSEELSKKEIDMIRKYNTLMPNGYNMTFGGEGTSGMTPWNKGIPRSEETIQKIKDRITPERRKKMRERVIGKKNPMYGMYGEKNPAYGKTPQRKINGEKVPMTGENNPFFGKSHTLETRTILSELQNKNKKKIIMCDVETGESIMEFESLSSAAKYLRENTEYAKADDSAIGKCAKGVYGYVYNHKWKFA